MTGEESPNMVKEGGFVCWESFWSFGDWGWSEVGFFFARFAGWADLFSVNK